jgi:hypothetical protein
MTLFAIVADQGAWECHYCGGELLPATATIEHIWPRSWGGTNDRWNLTLACGLCNGWLADLLQKCTCDRCCRALWVSLSRLGWTAGRTRRYNGKSVRDLVRDLAAG